MGGNRDEGLVRRVCVGHNDRVRERMKWKYVREQLDAVIQVRSGS